MGQNFIIIDIIIIIIINIIIIIIIIIISIIRHPAVDILCTMPQISNLVLETSQQMV